MLKDIKDPEGEKNKREVKKKVRYYKNTHKQKLRRARRSRMKTRS